MNIPNLHRIMLLTELHLKPDTLNECCDSITLMKREDKVWQSQKIVLVKNTANNLYVIKNVPKYLNINFFDDKSFYTKNYPSIKGFAISLVNYSETDSYMQDQLKSKARSQILRRIRRLEKCFDITHKRYYGKIDKDECLTLLALLKEMIIKRFQERNQVSDIIKKWIQVQTNLHSLIIAKKASLFIIYNGNTPIAMSVCYHYGNVLFSYITSYNTDYFKFGLGNILIYKKLEFCFENSYEFLEMGWGDLDYKRRWCNHIHNLDNYVVFPKNSLLAYLIAKWEGNKTHLKAYLISSKIYVFFKKTINLFRIKKEYIKNAIKYSFENLENSTSFDNAISINLTDEDNFRFKTIVNDFIYKTEEYYLDVKLYYSQNEGFYIIKGENHCKKIVFET